MLPANLLGQAKILDLSIQFLEIEDIEVFLLLVIFFMLGGSN